MPKFGELEAAIMDVVWAADDPLRVRDVVDALRDERGAAFTTVQTVMEILHRKRWLERKKTGRAYLYWSAQPREEYTTRLLSEALDTADDRSAALSRLLDQLGHDEIVELRRALNTTEKREMDA